MIWCCKFCGAGYDELPDGVNGCQECGTRDSLIVKECAVNDFNVPSTFRIIRRRNIFPNAYKLIW